MLLWNRFWRDESGMVLSAEAVLVGSVATVGVVAGLSSISHSIEGELQDVGLAIRSLDQSYVLNGHVSPVAWTAGSTFVQRPVEAAHADLGARVAADVKAFEQRLEQYRRQTDSSNEEPKDKKKPAKRKRMKKTTEIDESTGDAPPPNDLPAQGAAP